MIIGKNLSLVFFLVLQVNAIHVNQVGYYPFAKKIASVVDSTTSTFHIIDKKTNEVVFSGNCTPSGFDNDAEEYVSTADFTSFNKIGTYRIVVGTDTSYDFAIDASYNRFSLLNIIKSYYFQRVGMPLTSEYAGEWARDAGHLADSALSVYDIERDSVFDVRGGWYDAGDFGKYVVNAGITCGTMLQTYELCPGIIGDSTLAIPETGNKKSDLLDEIKYELDWLVRMQDTDGGVFFKVGPVKWYGTVMPSDDRSKRYLIGKSTTSTLNFTAVMAMAGRIYHDYDSLFAQNCVQRAERAWSWAAANPRIVYPENIGGTGPYEDGGDITYKDEFLWAITELCITTKKVFYMDTLEKLIITKSVSSPAWWQDVKNLSFFSLAKHNLLSDAANLHVKTQIITYADKFVSNINKSPYKTPLTTQSYSWGSSGICGNSGVVLAYAHYLTGEQKYLDALILLTDYLFGRNPLRLCYVTGIGSRYPLSPHHRQSGADNVAGPITGFVVGGANRGNNGNDVPLTKVVESGAPPAKCYIDDYESWASNENAINQNAPWVLVLSYLEANESKNLSSSIKRKSVKTHHSENNYTIKKDNDEISILFAINSGIASISIYDILGKCFYRNQNIPITRSIFINASKFKSGTFIVCVNGINGPEYSRVCLYR